MRICAYADSVVHQALIHNPDRKTVVSQATAQSRSENRCKELLRDSRDSTSRIMRLGGSHGRRQIVKNCKLRLPESPWYGRRRNIANCCETRKSREFCGYGAWLDGLAHGVVGDGRNFVL